MYEAIWRQVTRYTRRVVYLYLFEHVTLLRLLNITRDTRDALFIYIYLNIKLYKSKIFKPRHQHVFFHYLHLLPR